MGKSVNPLFLRQFSLANCNKIHRYFAPKEPKDIHSILANLATLASTSSDDLQLQRLNGLNGALRDGGHDAAEDACRLGGIRISIDLLKSKRPEVFHPQFYLISDVKICQEKHRKTSRKQQTIA